MANPTHNTIRVKRKIGANLSSKRLLNRIQFGKLHGIRNCGYEMWQTIAHNKNEREKEKCGR